MINSVKARKTFLALILKNHSLLNICAFVRSDNICMSPPSCWKKMYEQLSQE